MRIVFLKDLHASHLGFDPGMGLLYPAGAIVDDCLPQVEEKLLREGFAIPEKDWQQQQAGKARQHPPDNKRGRGAREDKAR